VTDETERPAAVESDGDARRYLYGAAATVVVFAGIAGYTLGANSPVDTARLASTVTLPVSGLSLAAYGVVFAGLLVVGIFGVVRFLSQFDDDAVA
jgi:hypothetical protein